MKNFSQFDAGIVEVMLEVGAMWRCQGAAEMMRALASDVGLFLQALEEVDVFVDDLIVHRVFDIAAFFFGEKVYKLYYPGNWRLDAGSSRAEEEAH